MRYTEILEACWSGYQQQGMKKKGDRMVPNCVPVSEQEMEEDLRKWFKEKWVRFGPDGKIRGDCARGSEGEGKPKCLPQSKAHALGKKGRASAAAKKRREDPNAERRGPAKNVATKVREQDVEEARAISRPEDAIAALKKFTAYLKKNINDLASMASFEGENYDQPYVDERFEGFLRKADGTPITPIFNEGGKLALVGSNKQYLNIPTALYYRFPAFMYGGTIENDIMQLLGYKQKGVAEEQLDEKQDACYRKVKSRYKVWPSAYASGALVQCRKRGAANWGTGAKKK